MPGLRTAVVPLLAVLGGCSPLLYVFVGGGDGEVGRIGLGQIVSSTTADDEDHWEPDCGAPAGGGDETWVFVPETRGQYRVRVEAQYDSVVAVRRGGPSGEEIACNDDFEGTNVSQLVVLLEAGETYAIVVDGYQGREGAYQLLVDREIQQLAPTDPPPPFDPAPVEDVGAMEQRCADAPLLPEGTSQGELSPEIATATTSCGGAGRGGDVVYRVEVATASTLQVQEHSEIDAILELRSGCSEGHRVVACVDDAPDVRSTAITSYLEPGTYYLIVDSYNPGTGGPFTLDVRLVPDAAAAMETR